MNSTTREFPCCSTKQPRMKTFFIMQKIKPSNFVFIANMQEYDIIGQHSYIPPYSHKPTRYEVKRRSTWTPPTALNTTTHSTAFYPQHYKIYFKSETSLDWLLLPGTPEYVCCHLKPTIISVAF